MKYEELLFNFEFAPTSHTILSDEEIFLLVLVFGDNSSGLSFVLVRGHIGLDLFIRNISGHIGLDLFIRNISVC